MYADAHCDISDSILYAYPEKREQFGLFRPTEARWSPHQIDVDGIRKADTKLMVWSMCPIEINANPMRVSDRYDEFLRHLDLYEELLSRFDDHFTLISSADDLDETFLTHDKVGVVLHIEGMDCIDKPERVEELYRLGVRSFGLVGISGNQIASSATTHPDDPSPISEFGKQIIALLETLPVALDCAHLNSTAFYDVSAQSKKPLYVSHTNCRSLCPLRGQNLSDTQLQHVADRNGLIGLSFFPKLLTGTQASIDDFVRHLEHALTILGPNHLCFGSDFDGMSHPAMVGLESMAKIPNLLEALNERLVPENLHRISFENLFRYFKSVLGPLQKSCARSNRDRFARHA